MTKVINLKSQEEITSVVERLWETGEEEVFLVAPKESSLLKNIIALKLLKREADRLGKEITLITKDTLGREMAKRVGLASKVALPKKVLAEEEEVFQEVAPEKFETMLEDEVRARREAPSPRTFGDIRPKGATLERRSIEVEQKEEKITLPSRLAGQKLNADLPLDEEFLSEEEPSSESKDLISKEKEGESFLERLQKKYQTEETLEKKDEEVDDEERLEETFDEPEEKEEELEKDEDDEIETFPIYSLTHGGRRRIMKEKKPFFGKGSLFNFKKIGEALKIEKIKPERIKKRSAMPFFSGRFLGIFIGAALLVLFLALYFILPKAEIIVNPKTEAMSQDLNIVADKGVSKISLTQNKIPAQLIKLDKRQSQEFPTTGQRQINDKAEGLMTIYNEYSSSPQALVEKTRFVSEQGKTFRLTKSITVPGAKIQEGKIVASSIEAEVVADQAGDDYNVGPGRFTIPGFQGTPKYAAFYGQSKSAMSGGAAGLMKVLAQDDYDKAKNALWQNLQPALDSEFKSQLPSGLKIVNGAMKEEISGVETDVTVGSPAEKFTMTLKGTAMAVLFDEEDILEIIKGKLSDELSSGKELALAPEQISYQLASVDHLHGQVSMKVKATGSLIWKIDSEGLKREISGQKEKAIREIFAKHSEVDTAKVIFWPFWVTSAPANLDKVIIQIDK